MIRNGRGRLLSILLGMFLMFSTLTFYPATAKANLITQSLVAGAWHGIILNEDGTVWGWGRNEWGNLGDGTLENRKSPVQVTGLGGIKQIAASPGHTLALDKGGNVWAWGENDYGQLGDGTGPETGTWGSSNDTVFNPGIDKNSPVKINISNVSQVFAGGPSSLATKTDGTVWYWGYRYSVYSGMEFNNDVVPVQVEGLTDVKDAAIGWHHVLVLKNNGTVLAWGRNDNGQLGDGTTEQKISPVQITGLENVKDVAAGMGSSMALKEDGTVWLWGTVPPYQDGTMYRQDAPIPRKVEGLSDIKAIAVGSNHFIVLKEDGTVWAWGDNFKGQLGNGESGGDEGYFDQITDKYEPIQVPGLGNIVSIAAGHRVSMAVGSDGKIYAWGDNTFGQLGDGTFDQRSSPVEVIKPDYTPVSSMTIDQKEISLEVGGSSATLLASILPENATNKNVRWESSDPGVAVVDQNGVVTAVGRGNTVITATSISGNYSDSCQVTVYLPAADPTLVPKNISAGWFHLAFLNDDGTVWCQGLNYEGSLGDGTLDNRPLPVQVNGLGGIKQISAGTGNTLALATNGIVWAWGENNYGGLGIGSSGGDPNDEWDFDPGIDSNVPVQVKNIENVKLVAVGNASSMAVTEDGTVWSWGAILPLQQDTNKMFLINSLPVLIDGLTDVKDLALGSRHCLILKEDGTVWSWGDNDFGQLGDGTEEKRYSPVQVSGLDNVTDITAGSSSGMALKNDGTVWVWGRIPQPEEDILIPKKIEGLSGVKAIAAGTTHFMALKEDGTVWAWGDNCQGQLGDGTSGGSQFNFDQGIDKGDPVQVPGLTNIKSIAAGHWFSAALGGDAAIYTWGYNHWGQLGDGTFDQRSTPGKVITPDYSSVSSITLNQKEISLGVGDSTLTLTPSILPESATNKNVKWESSDPGVAAVDQNGVVTAVGRGNTVITATSISGNYLDSCQVTVYSKPLAQLPDLAVSQLSINSTIIAGDQVNIRARVSNIGHSQAPKNKIKFYLVKDQNQVLLGEKMLPKIKAGGSYNVGLKITIPETVIAGQWSLKAIADEANQVEECNKDNNVCQSEVNVEARQIDLEVSSITVPQSWKSSNRQTLPVKIAIKNGGNQPADQVEIRSYISTDQTLDENDILISAKKAGKLGAGKIKTVKISCKVVGKLNSGTTYYVISKISSASDAMEANASNNVQVSIPIQVVN
ncbi:MAG: Ig-like domain-containing protein [Chitinophagales bacterium]